MIMGNSSGTDSLTRTAANLGHLKISHPDLHVSIAQLTGNTRWIDQPGQSIAYDGEMSPGQAVAFMGQLPRVAGRDFVHVIVYETFQADAAQMPMIAEERDAKSWCEGGPSRLRHWADAARVWSARTTHPANQVAAPFQVALEDGKVARLEMLSRPLQWPFCWWDAEGNPVQSLHSILPYNGDPPDGLWAHLTVTSTNAQESRRMAGALDEADNTVHPPGSFGPLVDTFTGELRNEERVEFGILVGPWKQIGTLEMDVPQTINGVTYTIRRPNPFDAKSFLIHFIRQGMLENEDRLVPVDAGGKSLSESGSPTIVTSHETGKQRVEAQPNFYGTAVANIKEWRVLQRRRQWITFNAFATNPKTPPAIEVTHQAALAAEAEQKRAAERARQEALQRRREEWRAVAADRRSERGVARMLVNAVDSHDEAAVLRVLTASEERVRSALPAMAHFLVESAALQKEAVKRFGEQPLDEALKGIPQWPMFRGLEREFIETEWGRTRDGAARVGGFIFKWQGEQRFTCEIEYPPMVENVAERVERMTGSVKRLSQVLEANPQLTMPEFKAAIETEFAPKAPATTQAGK